MDVRRTKRHFDLQGTSGPGRFSANDSMIDWELTEVNVPNSVGTGATFTGRFEVRVSSASGFQVGDPDYCIAQNLLAGLRAKTQVVSDNTILASNIYCYPTPFAGGSGARVIQFEGQAPLSEGNVPVTLAIDGQKSGNELLRETYTVNVTDDGNGGIVNPCTSDSDCGLGRECVDGSCESSGGGGLPLPCFVDPEADCGTIQTMAFGAIAIFLAFIVLAKA